jgi:hypothetical protein
VTSRPSPAGWPRTGSRIRAAARRRRASSCFWTRRGCRCCRLSVGLGRHVATPWSSVTASRGSGHLWRPGHAMARVAAGRRWPSTTKRCAMRASGTVSGSPCHRPASAGLRGAASGRGHRWPSTEAPPALEASALSAASHHSPSSGWAATRTRWPGRSNRWTTRSAAPKQPAQP